MAGRGQEDAEKEEKCDSAEIARHLNDA